MSAAVAEPALTDQLTRANGRAIAVWAVASAIGLSIVGLILAAPIAQTHGYSQLAGTIYKIFSFVCHQIPSRSFRVEGHQFGVCARCTGLYAGFGLATLTYPLVRSLQSTAAPARRWLILATLPLVIDFGLGYFSIWQNTQLSRFLTGALLSSVAVFYILPGLLELASARSLRLRGDSRRRSARR